MAALVGACTAVMTLSNIGTIVLIARKGNRYDFREFRICSCGENIEIIFNGFIAVLAPR